MISRVSLLILSTIAYTSAIPTLKSRVVTELNQASFEEAQQRDATATRLLSATEIKTSDGKSCLFTDILSGDFRANLTPIQAGACNGNVSQKWDVISAGKHNNVPGSVLVVNTFTQACMNFDPRRAAGNQVLLFSCGGRADGDGATTNSQLFSPPEAAKPATLSPKSSTSTCFTLKGSVIDQAPCNALDPNQSFIFGTGSVPAVPASEAPSIPVATKTASPARATSKPAGVSTINAAPVVTSAPGGPILGVNPTTPVPVSRARGVLDPSAAAQAQQKDLTATRPLTSVSLRSPSGKCLFIDPTAGDFRQNLIPIDMRPCTGSANERFDFITAGRHNNGQVADSALIVSSLMQGCLNFDDRRAAGDQVLVFSCGGRADGDSETNAAQLFPFVAGATSVLLAPRRESGKVCLLEKEGRLDAGECVGDQMFAIVP